MTRRKKQGKNKKLFAFLLKRGRDYSDRIEYYDARNRGKYYYLGDPESVREFLEILALLRKKLLHYSSIYPSCTDNLPIVYMEKDSDIPEEREIYYVGLREMTGIPIMYWRKIMEKILKIPCPISFALLQK